MTGRQVRLLASALCFVAAMLTIVATLMPLYASEFGTPPASVRMTVTAWGSEVSDGLLFDLAPKTGYPLVFAGIALLCAGAVGLTVARSGPGPRRPAGLVTATGTAFLAGTVWTVVLQAVSWVDSLWSTVDVTPNIELDAGYRAGFWLLLVALLLALVAAVLNLLPRYNRPWQPAAVDLSTADLETPPFGFAVVVPLPQQAPPSPYAPPPEQPAAERPTEPAATPEPFVLPPAPPVTESPRQPAVSQTEDPLAPPPD